MYLLNAIILKIISIYMIIYEDMGPRFRFGYKLECCVDVHVQII